MKAQFLVEYLQRFIGQKYIWGGNDAHDGGYDCSGLVLEGLRAIGLWGNSDNSSKGIFVHFRGKAQLASHPTTGDLLFFGKSQQEITHVAVAINHWQMVEAGGGDSKSNRGMVRVRPIAWRSDLVATLRVLED
jgi:cell wall-associated NlpC family hydrolase